MNCLLLEDPFNGGKPYRMELEERTKTINLLSRLKRSQTYLISALYTIPQTPASLA